MKQLTTEQQEQAIELIEKLVHSTEQSAIYNRAAFIESAKAFLQSLKPKIYVCMIELENNKIYFYEGKSTWGNCEEDAYCFKSREDASALKEKYCQPEDEHFKYFILTE